MVAEAVPWAIYSAILSAVDAMDQLKIREVRTSEIRISGKEIMVAVAAIGALAVGMGIARVLRIIVTDGLRGTGTEVGKDDLDKESRAICAHKQQVEEVAAGFVAASSPQL